jgi:hypothetical protein
MGIQPLRGWWRRRDRHGIRCRAHQRVDALLVGASAFYNQNRQDVAALTARYRIPANYPATAMVEAGGLIS